MELESRMTAAQTGCLLSVQRVLALYDAGILDLVAKREGGAFVKEEDGITVETVDGTKIFDVVIDARGQPSARVTDLPFPTLAAQIAHDASEVRAPYRLNPAGSSPARIYCLAMPQILSPNPFAQGLANCAAISKRAVDDIFKHPDLRVATSQAA